MSHLRWAYKPGGAPQLPDLSFTIPRGCRCLLTGARLGLGLGLGLGLADPKPNPNPKQAFRGLALTYTGVFFSVAAALHLVRTRSLGLLGVWAVYAWYCAGRAVAFAALGGLLGGRRHPPSR